MTGATGAHASVTETGASLEEAVAGAAHALGVTFRDVTVEILDWPQRGMFKTNRPARIRASVRLQDDDHSATEDDDQRDVAGGARAAPHRSEEDHMTETDADQKTPADSAVGEETLDPQARLDQLDEEAEIAADFVEGLLDLLSLPGDIEIVVREDQALVNVSEVGSGLLIGRRGATLDALQELVRCATQRRTERRTHVRVDIEGYRERQLEKLREKCRDAIAEVREHGGPVKLEPMDPFERKMMHDLVAKAGGVSSTSEGTEPRRRVVISPAGE